MQFELSFNITAPAERNFELLSVKGEYISIKGFEEFKFFVHKRVHEFKNICWEEDEFVITEYSTGASISSAVLLIDAIKDTEKKLNSVGVYGFKKKLEEVLRYMIKPANA